MGSTPKFLNEDQGATLFCDTCHQQVRSNEVHTCSKSPPITAMLHFVLRGKDTPISELKKLKKAALVTEVLSLQHHLNVAHSQLEAQPGHPFRLEQLIKEWILSFNKFGVGVWFEPSKSPMVKFAKDGVEVHVHHNHLLRTGMATILSMFHHLPDSATRPKNFLEGTDVTEDWRPEDGEQA